MKRKDDAFVGHKQKNNRCLVYLDVKLQQDRCASCNYDLKTSKWNN